MPACSSSNRKGACTDARSTPHRSARRSVGSPDTASCGRTASPDRSEEHTSELQSLAYLVCRLLLEKKKNTHRFSVSEEMPRLPHHAFLHIGSRQSRDVRDIY